MTGLWDWAVTAYARPGVEAVCLDLQDRQHQSVPYLLWAAWVAGEGGQPGPKTVAEAIALCRTWEAEIIAPLRAVRRRLHGPGREAVHESVGSAELAAERALMEALDALAVAPAARDDAQDVVTQVARAWSPMADPATLKLLATLLR